MRLRVTQTRWIWFSFSSAMIVFGVVYLALGGLQFGTDFTGGSLLQVHLATDDLPPITEVETLLQSEGFSGVRVQTIGERSIAIRTGQLSADDHQKLLQAVSSRYQGAEEESYSEVGPTLGRELQRKAVWAILFVLLGIICYVSWAFRKTSGYLTGWAFGGNAIIALIHDVFITVGAFAFLGYTFGMEIDALFVTALLTVLGFSVHDTIVVFDRIREGLRTSGGEGLAVIIDRSVNETLVRSINTSLTTLLVLFALYVFGGPTIQAFVLTLIIGITVGTYSSIFIASPFLLFWRSRRAKR